MPWPKIIFLKIRTGQAKYHAPDFFYAQTSSSKDGQTNEKF
jgi:hypothetical protein